MIPSHCLLNLILTQLQYIKGKLCLYRVQAIHDMHIFVLNVIYLADFAGKRFILATRINGTRGKGSLGICCQGLVYQLEIVASGLLINE